MIIPDALPGEVCDSCGLHLEEAFVQYNFPRKSIRLHSHCARITASRIRNHGYQLERMLNKPKDGRVARDSANHPVR